MQLRDYQREAVDAIPAYFEQNGDNPLIVVPPGGGKTPIMATFQKEALEQYPDTRILNLVHVKELVEQSYKTLLRIWPNAPVGLNCADLGSRDTKSQIIMASTASVYKSAYALQRVDLALVDECDLIPHSGEGMYRRLFSELLQINPYMKVCGFTGTPWRHSSGLLTEGDNAMFGGIAYEVKLRKLLDDGWLLPPSTFESTTRVDTSRVPVRAGEFSRGELATAADEVTEAAIEEAVQLGANRRSWLAFCAGVENAYKARDALRRRGISAETICDKTPKNERRDFIAGYRAGHIRCLTNSDILTVGFDAPATDFLIILRPTKSSRLWLQILGRGARLSPETGKVDYLVADYTSNSANFGPIDLIKPKSKTKGGPSDAPFKFCPQCEERCTASALICANCGHQFPPHELKIEDRASAIPLLSTQVAPPQWLDVQHVSYRRHEKAGGKTSLRVTYQCGIMQHSAWICLEHDGHARSRAVAWWQRHAPGVAVPNTVGEALAQSHALRAPSAIQVRPSGKFTEIVGEKL